MKAKCSLCGECDYLTKDHIIPKWAYKKFPFKQLGIEKNLGKKNIQMICQKCNSKKGGLIDCRHEIGRMFWSKVRDVINNELKKL